MGVSRNGLQCQVRVQAPVNIQSSDFIGAQALTTVLRPTKGVSNSEPVHKACSNESLQEKGIMQGYEFSKRELEGEKKKKHRSWM